MLFNLNDIILTLLVQIILKINQISNIKKPTIKVG